MSDQIIDPELLAQATPDELDYYAKLLRARNALVDPLSYGMYCIPGMQPFAHSQYLNDVLVALVNKRLYRDGPGPESVLRYRNKKDKKGEWVHPVTGEPVLHRLGISMPPQVGKSRMVGESFCPWYMRTHKDESLLYITYAQPLAEKISRRAKGTIERTPELGTVLDPNRSSIKDWAIDNGEGEFIARGVTGSVTGFGGNVIFDDPHENGIAAASDLEREAVLTLWDSSVATRTGGGFKWAIVIQTRWHEEDLTGHLQETDADKWFWVIMPALAYETTNDEGISVHPQLGTVDPLGRTPGESVCPELFAVEDFEAAEKRDPYWYGAEYQQLPETAGASVFTTFNYFRYSKIENQEFGVYEIINPDGTKEFVSEADCYRYAVMDLAAKEKQTSDYTVFGVFDMTPSNKLLLRHIERERVPANKHIEFLRKHNAIWKPEWVGIEDYTYGSSLLQTEIAEGDIIVRGLKEKGDKYTRALPTAARISNGQYFILLDGEWKKTYEHEMTHFLRTKHDDQVDVTSYAVLQWSRVPKGRSKDKADKKGGAPATAVAPSHRGVARRRRSHDEIGDE